jgi:succinate dehydrogenase / fumarate reductase, cytochrome b subunit
VSTPVTSATPATSAATLDYGTRNLPPLIGGRHYFLLRRLHSLTGLVFGGYLIVHLLVNATIAQGGTVYQMQVDKIHSLPFLPVIEWTFIYLPILFHTVYGIWITLTGQPNVDRYPYRKNQFYVAQRISAIVIVVFMLFHVLTLKYGMFGTNYRFEPHRALGTVGRHLDHWWVWPIYVIGIVASCYHLANGFWTAAITWGLTISEASQKRWGRACAGLFVLLTIAGLLAFFAGAALDWQDLVQTQQRLGHGS